MAIYAIDFDGTCVDHRYPEIGPSVPGAAEFLRVLSVNENQLILFTMRSGEFLDEAAAWFERHDIPLMGINENPEQADWTTSPKVFAHVYIDDAALGCPVTRIDGFKRRCVDWREVARLLGYDESVIDG